MRALPATVVLLLAGCAVFGPQPQPEQQRGTLWIDITNRSPETLDVATEGRGQNGGSAWATVVEGCQAFRTGGTLEQSWEILVGGEVVLASAEIPGGVPGGGHMDVLVRVDIAEDGSVTVGTPVPGGGPPPGAPRTIAGCDVAP